MKDKSYRSIGTDSQDDWMAQERRYEAKHSPWELDDNAAYLDEEHRKHCEAREAKRAHERECEVKRPDYEKVQETLKSQLRTVRKVPNTANSAAKAFAIVFTLIAIMIFMAFISVFIQIITRF